MQGVHPDLVKVTRRALELTDVDFMVIEGKRNEAAGGGSALGFFTTGFDVHPLRMTLTKIT